MDFAFLPPEVNSARMYCGPGSGPLLAAAAGWDSLAVELTTAADSYESVLSNLTSLDWQGPAAAAMAATATPYADWLRQTARLAKQAARQAWAAAAAYEQAWTSMVPPAAIDANRTLQRLLIATNYAGQNTAAIAATDAQYADFWAQDTAAMSGYETSSAAAAAQLAPFPSPDPTTNADAPSVQNAAVARAVTDAASTSSNQQALSAVGQTGWLPENGFVPSDFTALDGILAGYGAINSTYNLESFATGIIGAESNLGLLPGAATAAPVVAPAALSGATEGTAAAASLAGGAGLGNVSASVGGAGSIGPMSVPASWCPPSTAPVPRFEPLGMVAIPGTEEAAASGYPGYPGMPGAAVSKGSALGPKYGMRPTVMSRPLAGG